MTTVDSILSILEKLPTWKAIKEAPTRITELERRIAALETKLARCPGEGCPHCGQLMYRVKETKKHQQLGNLGARVHIMECEACGFTDEKLIVPK